jgi:hypothetical protein
MYKKSFIEGNKAQQEFVKQALKRDFTVHKSTNDQDKREHWDCEVPFGKVDVKGIKRKNRHGKKNSDIIWIEMRGKYDDGWLRGKADYIAFQHEKGFTIVHREELIRLVLRLVKTEFVKEPKLYKLYKRDGSLLTMIRLDDLKQIRRIEWLTL